MDITSGDILSFYGEMRNEISRGGPNIRALLDAEEINLAAQVEYLGKYSSICPLGKRDVVGADLDMDKVKDELRDGYYNMEALQVIGCATYSTLYTLAHDHGDIARLAKLKNSMKDLKKFGAASAFGTVMTGNQGEYVLKVPKNEEGEADGTHELFVGLAGINKLSKIVPNVTRVIGGVKCSRPIIDEETKKVISFCNSNSPDVIQYVQYENVKPGVSMREHCNVASVDVFMSGYLQFLHMTDIGSKLIGYTHYDAHYENVLVQDVGIKEWFYIPYTNYETRKTTYVKSKYITKPIDYGKATINFKGVPIGAPNQLYGEPIGQTTGPWPLHDAYKLLMFCGYELAKTKKNRELFEVLRKVFRFFNKTDNFEYAIRLQRDVLYGLPMVNKTRNYTISDLIDHVLHECGQAHLESDKPRGIVFQCTSCHGTQQVLDNVLVTKYSPTNFFDFYDIVRHLGSTSMKDYDRIVDNFDYVPAKKKYKARVQEDFVLMVKYLSSKHLKPGSVHEIRRGITARQLASVDLTQSFMSAYNKLIGAISLYEDVSLWLKVGNAVGTLYGDRGLIEYVAETREKLSEHNKEILKHIDRFRANYRIYAPIVESKEWDPYNSRYPWYLSSSGEIVHLYKRFTKDEEELFVEDRLPSTLTNLARDKLPRGIDIQQKDVLRENKTKVKYNRDGKAVDVTF